MQLNNKLESAYKLAVIKGLYRIANRILDVRFDNMNCEYAQTDGAKIIFNQEFLESLSTQDSLFIIAHEYYHIIYDHARRSRDNKLNGAIYNIACDLIINEHLVNCIKLDKPSSNMGVFSDNKIFDGMPIDCDTSMKVYDWLIKNKFDCESLSMEDIQGDIADNNSIDASKNYADRLAEESGYKNNKEISDVLERDIKQDDTQWMDLITAMRIESGRLVKREIVHNYSRPSRREYSSEVVLPASRHTIAIPKVDVYIDVSSSMGNNPLIIFKALKCILGYMIVYRPSFYSFNTDISKINMKQDNFKIGGGTDIRKVIEKIKEDNADLAILITDCEDSISREDIAGNTVVVSNNATMADFITNDWKLVKKRSA